MRFSYLFTLILFAIQGLLLSIEYREAENIKHIGRIFQYKANAFTKEGGASFRQSLLCMSHHTKTAFTKTANGNIDEAEYIEILGAIINSYPIQVKRTTTENKRRSVALFFDLPKPLVLEITAVQVDGVYKIDSISHLCELFGCVNDYFEHKPIE